MHHDNRGAEFKATRFLCLGVVVTGLVVGALPHRGFAVCVGDCDGSNHVTVDKIITMVDIALGIERLSSCQAGDADGNGDVTINEIIIGVNNVFGACPAESASPTPSTTPTASPTAPQLTPTPSPTLDPCGEPPCATVAATSNLWLAGMPDGTTSWFGDSAPATSPTELFGLTLDPATPLTFVASGVVRHGPEDDPLIESSGPDGGTSVLWHDFGPENGISSVGAPVNALMGVFLGPDRPDLISPPEALDFSSNASRDYLAISPALQQVFFIGDGRASTGESQQVFVPVGATRLFLGPMDASQYWNNLYSFTVSVGAPSP